MKCRKTNFSERYLCTEAIQKHRQSNVMVICSCGESFGPLSILPAAYANYQAFFSYLWVSSLMICLYQLKPYSPGTLTHSTVWSAHMLLSSQSAGKYSCICINCPLLIQVQIKMKIQLIRLGGRLCFNLSPIQIRNNSAEASRVNLILTQCEIRPRSMVSIIKVFIFF